MILDSNPHVRNRLRNVSGLVVLNASLALLVHHSAPGAPRNTDRQEYEYVGQHGFEPDCRWSIYCYRVLVPLALERIPINPEQRWRWYQATATAAAGSITSLMTSRVAGGVGAGAIAAVLAQTSYGFAFTAYDPYSADPLVFVFAAAIAWCWVEDRRLIALAIGLIGIFAKETVALVSVSCVVAALIRRDRPTWRAWVAAGVTVCVTLLAFHWIMDTYFGWSSSSSPAAQWSSGSWLVRWWRNNPFLIRKLYLLFAPFGFAWVFAALSIGSAERRLRGLALGAIVPFLALCYVQTPERALSNAFFVVVPLAASFLSRPPFSLALMTALANGAVTAKLGTSTTWLPASQLLMIPATFLAAWVCWVGWRTGRTHTANA
jgi:hypothetical protein